MAPRPQFAVVREDPEVELALIDRFNLREALLVASGGCTALTVSRSRPVKVTAFDFNPVQLAHCQTKARATPVELMSSDPQSLNHCGAFEGLFRVLRGVITEFVADPEAYFNGEDPSPWFSHPYWPTAFQLAFADPLLLTMFGPNAIQHAEPGSYPKYFQRVFERGLRHPRGRENPYLQHVLIGRYLNPPKYIQLPDRPVTWLLGDLLQLPQLPSGLISLSNIFDWSDDDLVAAWAQRICAECDPGTVVLIRQLNNQRDLRRFFSGFTFDDALAEDLLARDRSLFYERLEIGVR